MFDRTINIDAKPDWQTYYPPEQVGEYLESLWGGFKHGELIEMKPGMMIMTPQASLDGFLRWCAHPIKHPSKTNDGGRDGDSK